MKLPKRIGPVSSSGDYLKGIINEIRTKHSIENPITSGIVIPTANGTEAGHLDNVVNWKGSWQSSPETYPWLQLTFPQSLISPTGYSIKGPYSGPHCYAVEWDVYGIKDGDENFSNKWVFLTHSKASDTSFCHKLMEYACCDDSIGTYNFDKHNSFWKFRHLRFVLTHSNDKHYNCVTKHYFATGGIDFYGSLFSGNIYQSIKRKHDNNLIVILMIFLTLS